MNPSLAKKQTKFSWSFFPWLQWANQTRSPIKPLQLSAIKVSWLWINSFTPFKNMSKACVKFRRTFGYKIYAQITRYPRMSCFARLDARYMPGSPGIPDCHVLLFWWYTFCCCRTRYFVLNVQVNIWVLEIWKWMWEALLLKYLIFWVLWTHKYPAIWCYQTLKIKIPKYFSDRNTRDMLPNVPFVGLWSLRLCPNSCITKEFFHV